MILGVGGVVGWNMGWWVVSFLVESWGSRVARRMSLMMGTRVGFLLWECWEMYWRGRRGRISRFYFCFCFEAALRRRSVFAVAVESLGLMLVEGSNPLEGEQFVAILRELRRC